MKFDPVQRPAHYNIHPSGVECIEIAEQLGFNLGNAYKYVFRHRHKGKAQEDLQKALWYLKRECSLRDRTIYAKPLLDRRMEARLGEIIEAEPDSDTALLLEAIFIAAATTHRELFEGKIRLAERLIERIVASIQQ